MAKLLQNKGKQKTPPTTVVLLDIDITHVFKHFQSIMYVHLKFVPSKTQPIPSTSKEAPEHDPSSPQIYVSDIGGVECFKASGH